MDWQTEPIFLGLVTSHSQNRENQSDCRSVTYWEMAHSRPRIEAALSITLCHLGYQHLHSTRYRSSSGFHMTMQQVTNLSKECTLVYLVVQIAICNAVQHLSQQTSWFCSGRAIRSGGQCEVQQTSHIATHTQPRKSVHMAGLLFIATWLEVVKAELNTHRKDGCYSRSTLPWQLLHTYRDSLPGCVKCSGVSLSKLY